MGWTYWKNARWQDPKKYDQVGTPVEATQRQAKEEGESFVEEDWSNKMAANGKGKQRVESICEGDHNPLSAGCFGKGCYQVLFSWQGMKRTSTKKKY